MDNHLNKVLFLTNNSNAEGLYNWLKDRCTIEMCNERLTIEFVKALSPDMIISYNYNYIISGEIIDYMNSNIINLHISYLPWNRGFSPNIWSFIDNSPKGVTIHQIDAGLDKGKILFQKECHFNPEKETFITTYDKLNNEIVELFKENWEAIRSGNYTLHEAQGRGSYHSAQDLENLKVEIDFEWSDNIAHFLQRYETLKKGAAK